MKVNKVKHILIISKKLLKKNNIFTLKKKSLSVTQINSFSYHNNSYNVLLNNTICKLTD